MHPFLRKFIFSTSSSYFEGLCADDAFISRRTPMAPGGTFRVPSTWRTPKDVNFRCRCTDFHFSLLLLLPHLKSMNGPDRLLMKSCLFFFSPQCCHDEGPVRFYEGKVFSFFILLIGLIWSGRFCEQQFFLCCFVLAWLYVTGRPASKNQQQNQGQRWWWCYVCRMVLTFTEPFSGLWKGQSLSLIVAIVRLMLC